MIQCDVILYDAVFMMQYIAFVGNLLPFICASSYNFVFSLFKVSLMTMKKALLLQVTLYNRKRLT